MEQNKTGIWTQLADSIFPVDNHYASRTSKDIKNTENAFALSCIVACFLPVPQFQAKARKPNVEFQEKQASPHKKKMMSQHNLFSIISLYILHQAKPI